MGRSLLLLSVVTVGLVLAPAQLPGATAGAPSAVVASVHDGDTLTLTDGRRVRLLQIDAPEAGGECYSRAARTALLDLAPVGSRLLLEVDPRLDRTDRYGRILRYLWRNGVNVNVELVRRGAAAPYFYRGERGRYAARLMAAAASARAAKRGLWGASPRTRLEPETQVDTGRCGPAPTPPAPPPLPLVPPSGCDPNYAGGCVPPYPPDVNCSTIRALGIAPVTVIGSDPHGLDGDGDRLGCE